MKRTSLAAVAVLLVGIAVGAGAAGLGGEILEPAMTAIDEHMPDQAKEASGVEEVLDGVAEQLDELLSEVPAEIPEDATIPEDVPPEDAAVPEEVPPEEAEIPVDLPDDADVGLDLANEFLDTLGPAPVG